MTDSIYAVKFTNDAGAEVWSGYAAGQVVDGDLKLYYFLFDPRDVLKLIETQFGKTTMAYSPLPEGSDDEGASQP